MPSPTPSPSPHRDASISRRGAASLALAFPPSPRSDLGSMIQCVRCDDIEGAIAISEADEMARPDGES